MVQNSQPEHLIVLLITPTLSKVLVRTFKMPLWYRRDINDCVRIYIREGSNGFTPDLDIAVSHFSRYRDRLLYLKPHSITIHKSVRSGLIGDITTSIRENSDISRRTQSPLTRCDSKQLRCPVKILPRCHLRKHLCLNDGYVLQTLLGYLCIGIGYTIQNGVISYVSNLVRLVQKCLNPKTLEEGYSVVYFRYHISTFVTI